ncbi:hypothetical protein NPIL_681921 [Nephila pilipes]|uniref:Uncharacterized protein n=1 Tax=Nephila pilipes TaxID=299642 RepID=A0A8X6P1W8_NEPPI|nr:hypothetical protein NPIL_681921 [Nephila pilipes]
MDQKATARPNSFWQIKSSSGDYGRSLKTVSITSDFWNKIGRRRINAFNRKMQRTVLIRPKTGKVYTSNEMIERCNDVMCQYHRVLEENNLTF